MQSGSCNKPAFCLFRTHQEPKATIAWLPIHVTMWLCTIWMFTHPPLRTSYPGQTDSTSPRRWFYPRWAPGEILRQKRRRLQRTSQTGKVRKRQKGRIRAPESAFLDAPTESRKEAGWNMEKNGERPEIKRQTWQWRNVLVKAGSVGVFILLDNGDDKCDELGPKIQVLDAGSLFLWRHGSLLGLGEQEKIRTYSRVRKKKHTCQPQAADATSRLWLRLVWTKCALINCGLKL